MKCLCEGKPTNAAQQMPGNDFVSSVMQMFNLNADGGPLQMVSNMFMQLINSTASMMSPLLGGMQGSVPGDSMSFFNSIMQQFMSMFGQMSGLWSNTVNNQMKEWESTVKMADKFTSDPREYEIVESLVKRMKRAQDDVDKLVKNSDKDDSLTRERVIHVNTLMNDVVHCLSSRGYIDMTYHVNLLPPDGRDASRVIELQENILQMWPIVSRVITHEQLYHHAHPFTSTNSGHRCSRECLILINPIFDDDFNTHVTHSTESSVTVTNPLTTTTTTTTAATTQIGEIEFEESHSSSKKHAQFDP